MNSTFLILAGILLYITLYHTYGGYLRRKVVGESDVEVPSRRLYDGVDFVPANRYVLFGHHFASIAGAAPIVGPAIAIAWGWLPALLWVWVGNIFVGAVHDYLSLMTSVRYDGHSVQWVAGKVIKERTGYVFAWFIFFVLVLVVAAFGAILGHLCVKQPAVPTAYIFQTLAAITLGYLLYKVKMDFRLATVIGIILLVLSIMIGERFPLTASYKAWMITFFCYIIVAASIPVNILLQPRDYLNAWLLVGGLVIGVISTVFALSAVKVPTVTVFSAPVIAGKPTPFWPVIPLIVACGSLSGFHAIVASGTTSKQISSEEDGLFIGYGGMLTEGFLSTIVIVAISTYGLAVIPPCESSMLQAGGAQFAANYMVAVRKAGGPIGIFSKSFAEISHAVLHLPREFLTLLASMWVASFAMTTLDTTNRLARYTFAEILEPVRQKAPRLFYITTNKWVASLIPATMGIGLAWSGAWTLLWPVFGGANQMLASIALMTAAAWAIRVQKTRGLSILIPALFLWITVSLAMLWYLFIAVPTFYSKDPLKAVVIATMIIVMLCLNLLLLYDYFRPRFEPYSSKEA